MDIEKRIENIEKRTENLDVGMGLLAFFFPFLVVGASLVGFVIHDIKERLVLIENKIGIEKAK